MIILGIETSCDETAAAVVEYRHGRFRILANVVSSQINIHQKYGGVVPEIAARKQVELIIPVIMQALSQAGIKNLRPRKNDSFPVSPPSIDAIGVTVGPGLMIALSVGVETARTLAAVWNRPIIAVNHLEGHLYSALLPAKQSRLQIPKPVSLKFPAIALIVSGGHTELILVIDYLAYKLLGRTRDDAAGEAYDKVAKLLGLGYPGGPVIDTRAQQGDPNAFDFPRGMIRSGDYDFSFSGLKTAVLYTLQRHPELVSGSRNKKPKKQIHSSLNFKFKIPDSTLNNLCASFQSAVVDVLIAKTLRAAGQYKAKTILLGGGVAANSLLRKQLIECTGVLQYAPTRTGAIDRTPTVLIPHLSYTTDNAAMIAATAAFHAVRKQFTPWYKLKADPNLSLSRG